MGRVIRTFITAGGYRGEGNLNVSAKAAHSGEGEVAGARMPSCPPSPGTAAHTAKQGRICWGFHDREKTASSLTTAYQNPAGRRVRSRETPDFFLCPSALGPQKVGVGASPQNAFGCQWQAKRSACPHLKVGKMRSPAVRVFSALWGRCGNWNIPPFALRKLAAGPRGIFLPLVVSQTFSLLHLPRLNHLRYVEISLR